MTEATKLRLFVAVSVPELHRAWIAEQVSELARQWPETRWIPPDNQHITLKFLGSTPADRLEQVMSSCEQVAAGHRPGSLSLTQLGVFPSLTRARVLWIGLDDPAGLLTAVACALDERLTPLGFEAEKRAFSPHLTIARFRQATKVDELPPLKAPPAPFAFAALDLWRSHLSSKGARYERLASFLFG